MAEHHGVGAGRVAHGAFRVGMEIATADANGFHTHLDFTGGGVFDRSFGQLELSVGNEFGNKHYGYPTAIVK